jgi:hypothetical protein
MKAIFLGYRGPSGQILRIEDGWKNIGEEVCELGTEPEIIFCNDSGFYNEGIVLKGQFPKAKLILNVLDVPKKYYPDLNLENLKNQLLKADIVTSISKFSQKQVEDFLDMKSYVIYNPVKDISNKNLERDIDFIYIGRLYEENKRFNLAVQSLSLLNIKTHQLYIAGPDDPGRGLNYLGTVDDYTLDMLYNRSKFLVCPTEYGVLGLPPIEAAICGCIPILCNDNEAAEEFNLSSFAFNPNPKDLAQGIININYQKARQELDIIGKKLYDDLNKNKIAQNIKDLIC